MVQLILKRTKVSRPSGQWRDDDYVVLENGVVVGRIFKVPVAPQDRPWMWASGHSKIGGRRPVDNLNSGHSYLRREMRALPSYDASPYYLRCLQRWLVHRVGSASS
jgi:hypothetical protein